VLSEVLLSLFKYPNLFLLKCFEEIRPEDLVITSDAKNETGDIIHSAIYARRNDVRAVVHAHTPAVVAVSTLQEGFQFLDQNSGQFYGGVGYHEYEGMSDDPDEQGRIGAALGETNIALFMRNHGAVTVGRTIEEAWVRMYYLDFCCKLQLSTAGKTKVPVDKKVLEHLRKQYEGYVAGEAEWPALLRRLARQAQGWSAL
jgi:ribulose-5-phosphate 4-epimerase/fuculose-1-phosphate aldolase